MLGVCRTYKQLDARNRPWDLWFREVQVNRNRFELGLNNLPGRTPDPFTAA
jgi:hypothetical protein